jgi:hypothetical protein
MENSMVSTMKSVSVLSVGFETLTREVQEIRADISKRIYLSAVKLNLVKKAVKSRAADICTEKGYEYRKAYRYVIQALYRGLNDKYNVTQYRELPDIFYKEIIEYIESWNLPTTIEARIEAA